MASALDLPVFSSTAAAHPSVAIMEAARRKRVQEEAELARKIAADEAAAARAAAEELRQIEAAKRMAGQETRAITAADRLAASDQREIEKERMARLPAEAAAEMMGYDSPVTKGQPWSNTIDLVREGLLNKYRSIGGQLPGIWNEAQRNISGNPEVGMPGLPTVQRPGETTSIDSKGNVTRQISAPQPREDVNASPAQVADAAIDPTGLTPAERNKALARARMAEREWQQNKDKIMPAGAVDKLSAFQEVATLADAMNEQVQKLKDSDIGPIDTTIARVKNFMGTDPETGMGAASPAYNEAMNAYNTVRNIILKARSGGAVTPSEADRLLSELGDPARRPGTFKQDVTNFVRNRKADVQVHREALEAAGYKVPGTTSAAVPGVPPNPTPAIPSPVPADAVVPPGPQPGQPPARPAIPRPVAPAPATAPTAATPAPRAAPKIGTVTKGYRFKGGNANDPENWEKVKTGGTLEG